MNKTILLVLVLVIFIVVAADPASAAMEIRRINFNPDGRDSATNSHLNREYIYLVNTGPRAEQLRGWKLFDRGRDHVYRFGALYLEPGDTIRLRSGRGNDGAGVCEVGGPCPENTHYDVYWGLTEYVWDNGGDRATLTDDAGTVVDRCRYGASASNPKRC